MIRTRNKESHLSGVGLLQVVGVVGLATLGPGLQFTGVVHPTTKVTTLYATRIRASRTQPRGARGICDGCCVIVGDDHCRRALGYRHGKLGE
jgi:hypothetical protein